MQNNEFKGFDRDTLFLLSQNKFNDSRAYYESVKEEIKQKAIVPVRQICSELSEQLFEIDPQMNLVPTKMVSRIRRDTRFSKNKEMYRSNVWAMFMRDKHKYKSMPCMWFEYGEFGYDIGVGMFKSDARYLDYYRKVFLKDPKRMKKAIDSAEKCGAFCDCDYYSREKEGTQLLPKNLQRYYNVRSLYFIVSDENCEKLFDGSILEEIRTCIKAFEPMYKILLEAMEQSIAEKGVENYD